MLLAQAALQAELDRTDRGENLNLTAPIRKAVLPALSRRIDEAGICRDRRGHPEPDPKSRNSENVPLLVDFES